MLPTARLVLLEGPDFLGPMKQGVPEGVLAISSFIESITPPGHESETRLSPETPLSRRQAEVLHLVAAGRTNREVADELVVSVRTGERHLAEAYAKLGAHNRYEAIAMSRRFLADSPTA